MNMITVWSKAAIRLCLLCATLTAATAWAQSNEQAPAIGRDGPGITWRQLSSEQQRLLSGVQEQWAQLPPGRQVALAQGAQRYLGMNDKQREQADRRFAQWNALTDAERATVAARFEEFRRMSPEEKARIRRAQQRYQQMTPEQQKNLRDRFDRASPPDRPSSVDRPQRPMRPQR